MAFEKDSLGDRMKETEGVSKTHLTRRIPVILRLDGKAFHSFCASFRKPYDERFHRCMWETAKYLCTQISGAKIAYVQSDEISILITDYDTLQTQAWFNNSVQKMVSVSAGMASVVFYQNYLREFEEAESNRIPSFDARVFSIPKEDVTNCFLWRQQDASRNSLSMACQSKFSHKQLNGVGNAEQHDLLHSVGINWNDYPVSQRRGVCVVRETYNEIGLETGVNVTRSRWKIDMDIPVFSTPEGREYIDRFVRVGSLPVSSEENKD